MKTINHTTTTHTPGPWLWSRHGAVHGGIERDYSNGKGTDQIAMVCEVRDPNAGDKVANTALIAAAPDLLQALIDLARNVETDMDGYWTESTSNFMQQADEAIAKARNITPTYR